MDIGNVLGEAMDPKANAAKLSETEIRLARERYEQAKAREEAAHRETREAELAYLEAKGEREGYEAQFIRAWFADDYATMHRLRVEGDARMRAKYPDHHAQEEAEIAEAAKRIGSVQ